MKYDSRMLRRLSNSFLLRYSRFRVLRNSNFHKVNFSGYTYNEDNKFADARFFNNTEDSELIGNTKMKTRWRISQTPLHLEYIFTNWVLLIGYASINTTLGKCYHSTIVFSLICKTEPKYPVNSRFWTFKRLNVSAIGDKLQCMEWEDYPQIDVDAHWDMLLHMNPKGCKPICSVNCPQKLQQTHSHGESHTSNVST